jgi:hypothetical protein
MAALQVTRVDHPASQMHTLSERTVRLNTHLPVAAEARELRGSYAARKSGDKTKTASDSIAAAARQAALGHQALVQADLKFATDAAGSRMDTRIFLPMIVTTARLSSAKVDPSLIASDTAEIPLDGLKFERRGAVIFEYPVPYELQRGKAIVGPDGELTDSGSKLHVLVVNSAGLRQLLDNISRTIETEHFVIK